MKIESTYLTLWDILQEIAEEYQKHFIVVKYKKTFEAFDKHYQYILTLDDFQDRYLEAVKLMYEVVMQHPLTDGNKRLSARLFDVLLGNNIERIERKLGE